MGKVCKWKMWKEKAMKMQRIEKHSQEWIYTLVHQLVHKHLIYNSFQQASAFFIAFSLFMIPHQRSISATSVLVAKMLMDVMGLHLAEKVIFALT